MIFTIDKKKKYSLHGEGYYTHPPILYSKAIWSYFHLNKSKHLIKKIDRILDIGCAQGAGPIFASIFFRPEKIVGIDIDKSAILEANKKKKLLKIKNCFFYNIDIKNFFNELNFFDKKKYDIVIANGSLPYILELNELILCLNKISKNLKKNGIFSFTMFGDNNPFRKKGYIKDISKFSPNMKYIQVSRITSKYEIIKILKKFNLRILNNGFSYIKKYNLKKKNKNNPYSFYYEVTAKKI